MVVMQMSSRFRRSVPPAPAAPPAKLETGPSPAHRRSCRVCERRARYRSVAGRPGRGGSPPQADAPSGRAAYWPTEIPPGHVTISAVGQWHRADRGLRRERVLPDIDAHYGDRRADLLRHGVLLDSSAPGKLRLPAGQEHGRTIPLADFVRFRGQSRPGPAVAD
jgi:hypothetical protein